MKVLSFTGGSVQGVGLAGIGCGIMETYEPDVIIGTSVSAIFAIPLAMRKTELIKKAMLSFDRKAIFGKYPPLNKKNSFLSLSGFFRMITGKDSLGKQDALIDFIKLYLTKDLFEAWKNLKEKSLVPYVIIATTNYTYGTIDYWNLSEYNYEAALQIILASCNIPVLINGIKLGNNYHFDGGVISAQSGKHYLQNYRWNITEWRSVWARPKHIVLQKEFTPKNVLNVTARSLELMIKNESLESEFLENLICSANKIEHRKYFFKTELDSLYDTDLHEREADWNNGLKIGRK